MNPTDALDEPAPRPELQVLQGRLKGARCALQHGRPTTVGAGPDNDIVLPASDIGSGRVSLSLQRLRLTVRVLQGEAVFDGQSRPAGSETTVPLHTPVQLGLATVAVCATATGRSAATPPARSFPWGRVPRGGWLAVGAVLFAGSLGGLAAGSSAQDVVADPRQTASTLESAFHEAGFDDLRVRPDDRGALHVTGYLQTAAQRAAAATMLRQTGLPGRLDVGVNAVLAAAVQEVFRAHHVAARAVLEGPGQVTVHTQEADTPRLQQIASRARQDVPGLRSLDLRNVPPAPASDLSHESPFQTPDPGKRIAAIVPGDAAYIVTADGSRYFEGAVMPSGQRIAAIRAGEVQLERDGLTAGRTSSSPTNPFGANP
jgi:type III secretion protein D